MSTTIYRPIVLLLTLLAVLLPGWAQDGGSERILDYHSAITVNKDSTLAVRETIRVQATGNQIRHGIYRDFPTRYRDKWGNNVNVSLHLYSVSRDGSPEPYHTQSLSNGLRIYIGDKDRFISPGEHTYLLSYGVTREIGFFKDHDELYWNVTGNGWIFPIDRVSATVTLPADIPRKKVGVEGYTGPQGSRGKDYQAWVDAAGQAQFVTTRMLGANEGLTIVVTFPKGYVTPPSTASKISDFFQDNRILLLAFAGFLVVLGYFLIVWINYGRDLPAGTIIPHYTPPVGYSPAGLRYVRKMAYDNKAFAAAIIDLAVKGRVAISEDKEGLFGTQRVYTLAKLDTPPQTPQDPRTVIETEIKRGATVSFTMLAQQAKVPVSAVQAIVNEMTSAGIPIDITGDNVRMYAPAAPMSGSTSADAVSDDEEILLSNLLSDYPGIIALKNTNYAEIQQAIAAFRSSLRSQYEGRFFVTNTTYFAPGVLLSLLILFGVGSMAVKEGGGALPISLFIVAAAYLITDGIFYYLMKAPTYAGRKLLDEIEGFRMYLDTAEKDEMNLSNPPEKTPELFEKYLPYALALDVEQRWAERFAGVLARATVDGHEYHPGWYHGNSWGTLGAAGFASSLGDSFSSAISSSSTAPGSSSGSGGGGSSGGGGGGGGGGGW